MERNHGYQQNWFGTAAVAKASPHSRYPKDAAAANTMSHDLQIVAESLVADGKGILAADETTPTLTKRFDILGIASTEQSRRAYREMLFTSPGAADFISGAIMYDETIRQKTSGGVPFAKKLESQGVPPGIKVDTGAKPFAASPKETITEGLDGLRDRLREYRYLGARFAKWRAVIHVTDSLPSAPCVSANAHALARYASLCQEQDLVPIVELMEGSHSIGRCERVTSVVLHAVFDALFEQDVVLRGDATQAQHDHCRQAVCPTAYCAGGCGRDIELFAPVRASCRPRDRISVGRTICTPSNRPPQRNKPDREQEAMEDQFSYGRTLQDPALEAWHGRDEYLAAGQRAFGHRACLNGAAALGRYINEMEIEARRHARVNRHAAATGTTKTDDGEVCSVLKKMDHSNDPRSE
jgi:fructose-bisphosphate aldolase, class I